MITDSDYSSWLRDLKRQLEQKTLFVLHGNIYDLLQYPYYKGNKKRWTYLHIKELLSLFFLKKEGYGVAFYYDFLDGITFVDEDQAKVFQQSFDSALSSHAKSSQQNRGNRKSQTTPLKMPEIEHSALSGHVGYPKMTDFSQVLNSMRLVLHHGELHSVYIIDFASRLLDRSEQLSPVERKQFVSVMKCAREAALKTAQRSKNSTIILICDKVSDLPAWLYLNNPLAATINIALPDQVERQRYFEDASIDGFYNVNINDEKTSKNDSLAQEFTGLTRGFNLYDLECLRQISWNEKLPFCQPKKIIERYKFGKVDSAWDRLNEEKDKEKFKKADEELKKRVLGQDTAVSEVVDVIKRAAVGLSGIHHSAANHKPKGVLFFAGPTGVGKTELAKSMAELLFNDENAYIRFDMSEYGQEHSDQKLFGAPPGYVGYQEGGQLTNRIRENPFAVLLFDEIEKAHPKIMDKFLQILEDGRMTDGRGETVFFSDSVIIFTSNIGAYREKMVRGAEGPVVIRVPNVLPYSWKCNSCSHYHHLPKEEKPTVCEKCGLSKLDYTETPYLEVKKAINKSIEAHFKEKLGRPELYNRIGNNFVVFDYIRKPVIEKIVKKMLTIICEELKEKRQLSIIFSPEVTQYLVDKCSENLEKGGRGIGNLIETVIENPLARHIFDLDLHNKEMKVEEVKHVVGMKGFDLKIKILRDSI